jgi:hypothetical protein
MLVLVVQAQQMKVVLVVQVKSVAAIVAPSYRFYPDDTTEASLVASTLRRYGMVSDNK